MIPVIGHLNTFPVVKNTDDSTFPIVYMFTKTTTLKVFNKSEVNSESGFPDEKSEHSESKQETYDMSMDVGGLSKEIKIVEDMVKLPLFKSEMFLHYGNTCFHDRVYESKNTKNKFIILNNQRA